MCVVCAREQCGQSVDEFEGFLSYFDVYFKRTIYRLESLSVAACCVYVVSSIRGFSLSLSLSLSY